MLLGGCDNKPLNSPYPNESDHLKVLHKSFVERPKTLDPARAYSSNEYAIMHLVYEPLLTYDYLKRPYTLIPLTATSLPDVSYFDRHGHQLTQKDSKVSYTTYTFHVKDNVYYAPHPAFYKDANGRYAYLNLPASFFTEHDIESIEDFPHKGSRKLLASDYIYQIKRLASPRLASPILGVMKSYILGLDTLAETLKRESHHRGYLDLRKYSLKGVKLVDDHTFKITIKGRYPAFMYWLAMPFFSPLPWEADKFFQNEALKENNLSLDWYPIGTGPFMLTENNPNRRIVLKKNPLTHPMFYPKKGSKLDVKRGYLKNAGRKLPMLDEVLYSLEKESIPRWNKFLQGYYDLSAINSDSFDAAVSIDEQGVPRLSKRLKNKSLRLDTAVEPSIFYIGFNMLDSVVGGYSKKATYLRQAISIAIDYEEYIAIFLNGRGVIAQGPIPPGIFGFQSKKKGLNPFVYQWNDGRIKRKSIDDARALMAKAGYPNGITQSGKRLVLHFDTTQGQGPEQKAYFSWLRKQFKKIGISLNVRATDYNRFQDKIRHGKAQLFSWGWHADYPDAENFFFLLTSKNSKVHFAGENAANYSSKIFDRWFEQMKVLPDNKKKLELIHKMIKHLQKDSPWVWGYYPKYLLLTQPWVSKVKLNSIGGSIVKYMSINTKDRASKIKKWNKPILWPVFFFLGITFLFFIPVIVTYHYRAAHPRRRIT